MPHNIKKVLPNYLIQNLFKITKISDYVIRNLIKQQNYQIM